jgi:hypothetical protein
MERKSFLEKLRVMTFRLLLLFRFPHFYMEDEDLLPPSLFSSLSLSGSLLIASCSAAADCTATAPAAASAPLNNMTQKEKGEFPVRSILIGS